MEDQRITNQRNEDRILALEKGQEKIISLLEPISETYRSVSLIGKWLVAVLVFITIAAGAVTAITKFIHK